MILSPVVLIVYLLFVLSLICYIVTAIILHKTKRNPLIFLLCIGGSVLCLASLTSPLYNHEDSGREKPESICFVQAIVVSRFCNRRSFHKDPLIDNFAIKPDSMGGLPNNNHSSLLRTSDI